jgi:hypothetical protein
MGGQMMLTPITSNIPQELKALPRWLTWRAEVHTPGEKPRKVPYNAAALNSKASSTDPATWSTFEQAEAAYAEREGDADAFTGVGFVLDGDGVAGIDLDDCVTDGKPDPAALQLLGDLNAAYIEISPSGTGLRGFGYAPPLVTGARGKVDGLKVEVYSAGRYLTLTGHTLKTGPLTPLRGFAELATRIRGTAKTNPQTGEPLPYQQDARHAELVRCVMSGDVFHDSLRDLAASLVVCGMKPGAVVNHLRGLMDVSAAPHDARWLARRGQIPDLVSSAERKRGPSIEFGTVLNADTGEIIQPETLLKPVSVFDVLTHPAPPPAFVWDGYLPRGVVTLFCAHGGTGKSTIALMLAVATVTGRPLFGVPTEQSPAMFVSLEDGAGIVRHRLAGICLAWGINPLALGGLHIVDGTDNPELYTADPRSAGDVTNTYTEMARLVQSTEAGLVVVDNASDSFGGDEINRRQVRAFMRSLGQVARLTDCAVCLLAHVDKGTSRHRKAEGGEGYSGSTAWHNSARSRLFMSPDQSGLLTLEHQKSNLGRKQEPLTLVWPEGGLPMLATDAPNFDALIASGAGRADDKAAAALLVLLAEFEGRSVYASTAGNSPNNPHNLLKTEPGFKRLKLRRDDVKRIVNQCQRAGWIERLEYRTPDRKLHERWTLTASGCVFAGLAAPSAPSGPDGADMNMAQASAQSAPSGVGGVGGGVRTQHGAEDGADALPRWLKTTMK